MYLITIQFKFYILNFAINLFMQIEEELKSHIIFIANIYSGSSKEDIQLLFQKYGKVNLVDIIKKKNDHTYAFIEYDDMRDAYDALEALNGYDFKGKKLRIQFKNGGAKLKNEYLYSNAPIVSAPRIQQANANHNKLNSTSQQNSNSMDSQSSDSSQSEKDQSKKKSNPSQPSSQRSNQDSHGSQQSGESQQSEQSSKGSSKESFKRSSSKRSSKRSSKKSSKRSSIKRSFKRSSEESFSSVSSDKRDGINKQDRSHSRSRSRSSSSTNKSMQIKRLEKDVQNLSKKVEDLTSRLIELQKQVRDKRR